MATRLMRNLEWHWETKRTRLLYGWRLAYLGHGAIIEPGARVSVPRGVSLGQNARVCRGARITTTGKETEHVRIGENAVLAGDAWLDAAGGHIDVGRDVYIGPHTYVGGHGGCSIGDDCQIAGYCYIIAANHEFDDRTVPIRLQGYALKGISIGPDCWLGNGVTVLDGVTVGRGCVLAARAVVTKDVPEWAVVGGVPARILRYRGSQPVDDVGAAEESTS